MTNQNLQFPKFYVTASAACPYLDGEEERKVFTELQGPDANALNEALGKVGFRRSQNVVYRPACEACAECVSVRVDALAHTPSKSIKRIARANADIQSEIRPPIATQEQYDLLSRYLNTRHSDGSMADMTFEEYKDMVEASPVQTITIEYRRAFNAELMAVALTDELSDGFSMVYSFFNPDEPKRSFGTYLIHDHINRAQLANQQYIYLGYFVEGSTKMNYKSRFKPLERLGPNGWYPFDAHSQSV
ncbi:arginyltransferase [Kordiimonas aquimaris]|uniref:arginyltransferase n=1 Tax=Kordiimonas aquimaris TaxID=707591 RepID=UPI0021CED57E|nr:arginyltransferase [Kordiimonas aquimaris]